MSRDKITFCLSTYNTLNYLKLAVKSVRKNSYYQDAPFIIYAENCNDGTDEWLRENRDRYKFTYIIEKNEMPEGIGGGMNIVASHVETEYIGFLSSDFYMGWHWDKPLVELCERFGERTWAFSYRVEPRLDPRAVSRPGTLILPPQEFGHLHDNFEEDKFILWSKTFCEYNKNYLIRKPEGVSGVIRKKDWDYMGGNDPRFAPAYWEDMDLFIRMLNEGYQFYLTGESVLYHFGSRTSRYLGDNFQRPKHLEKIEQVSLQKFLQKYGKLPEYDSVGAPKPMPIQDGTPNRF